MSDEVKRKRALKRLFISSIILILLGLAFIIANLIIDKDSSLGMLVGTINLIIAFSLISIGLIIILSIYKEGLYYKIQAKREAIKNEPLYELNSFNLDVFKESVISEALPYNKFYRIDKGIFNKRTAYYFYFIRALDFNSELPIEDFKKINDNSHRVLICILEGFRLEDSYLDRVNSYDKSRYMLEYLNTNRLISNIILCAYNEDNKVLRYYKPKARIDFSYYMRACRLIKRHNK